MTVRNKGCQLVALLTAAYYGCELQVTILGNYIHDESDWLCSKTMNGNFSPSGAIGRYAYVHVIAPRHVQV